ncbi:MAG: FG-GAP repeat domain-containing protein, partial [Cyclonatronaceae bacterium]
LSGLLSPIQFPGLSDWRHQRYDYSDFDRERLLLHMRSTEGPAMCTGDATGNGLEDLYIGGARGQAGALWLRQPGGSFTRHSRELFEEDAISEDINCQFFNASGSGADDLYVVSGGNSFSSSSSALADRLYLNDGQGNYSRSGQILPTTRGFEPGSVVRSHDFTGDGNQDLFVGIRLRPFSVGMPVSGYLLEGDGTGRFTDVTDQWVPELLEAGMITDALWADLTGDGADELVIAGEWMPVRVFANRGQQLEETTAELGLENTHGWWNAIAAGDVNGDGRIDLIGGNHGRNSIFKASEEHPVKMWAGDIAGNGMTQQILSYPRDGIDYPVALRHDLIAEIPRLASRYPDYASYGGQSVQQIFSEGELSNALELRATELRSMIFWNEETGFRGEALPLRAQLAPMYGVHATDLTGNGTDELLMGGNLYDVKPQAGPYDASRGVVIGYENGKLGSYPPQVGGMNTKGEIRGIESINTGNGTKHFVIVRYDAPPVLLEWGSN